MLFDIDGTLLNAAGVSRAALTVALAEVFGVRPALAGYDFAGKTDPQIVREVAVSAGVPTETVSAGLGQALGRYERELCSSLRPADVTAKPGAVTLVRRLAELQAVTLGLLTGNLEACARAKLGPLGVNVHFAFGAYGSDHEQRARLPEVAVTRARAATGRHFVGAQVVVVGDSVHDVRCGRHLGVRAVAVATGPTPVEHLRAEVPDALLADFGDTEAALEAILG